MTVKRVKAKSSRANITAALISFLAGGFWWGPVSPAATALPAYAVAGRIAGPDGFYDYVSLDSRKQRLFVGRGDGVMAVDLRTQAVTPALIHGVRVHAVLIIPGTNLMLGTSGGTDRAILFDRDSGAVKAEIPTGKNPDAALFEPVSKLAFVMNGDSKDITVIDVQKAAAVATIALGGKPEAGVADSHNRLYVNIEDAAEIAVIDVAARQVIQRYALPGCREPTGLALDTASGQLVSACQNGVAKLVDSRTGADRGTLKIAEGADGVIVDGTRHLVFIPCFAGTLEMFRLGPTGTASVVTQIPTQQGARTAALDPRTGRLYLPTARFTSDGNGQLTRAPGSFAVLIVAAK